MGLSIRFLAGLILGGILGFMIGFLLRMAFEPKAERLGRKRSEAERLFDLAMQQEKRKRKIKLLGQVLDRYPHSEWADKALEEVMKMRK